MLKILLTIAVGVVFYFQFKKLAVNQLYDFKIHSYFSIIALILLTLPNYFFEYQKWNAILKSLKIPTDKATKIQSFFAGIITGMLTPNMQGNFIGRIYYFQRRFRISIVLLTLTANLGQFIVTIVLGVFGLVLSSQNIASSSIIYPLIVAFCALLFYFSYEKIQLFSKKFKWYKRIGAILKSNATFRIQILWWSLLRHAVFSLQFFFALHAFGQPMSLHLFWLVWLFYLWTTLSPSLFLGKLFIRESIALLVFAGLAVSQSAIVVASLTVWIFNLFLPTVLGLIICRKSGKR